MPALPNVPGVLRLQLKHQYALDTDALVRIFLAYTGTAPTSASLNTMCSTVATAWGTNLKSLCTSSVELTQVNIVDLTSSSAGVGTATATTVGTRTGGTLPAQTAALVNFALARRYRGGKPRIYLPFGSATDLTGSQSWTAGFLSAIATGWGAFLTAVIAAAPGGTTITGQVNVSYFTGFTVVTNPVTGRARNVSTVRATPLVDTVAATSYSTRVATQRRRTTRK